MDKTIDEVVYNMANTNLIESTGESLAFSKELFLKHSEEVFGIFDISEYQYLDIYNYYIALYLGLLNRYPDDSFGDSYDQIKDLPEEEAKVEALVKILNSPEYKDNNNKMVNNILNIDGKINSFTGRHNIGNIVEKVPMKQRIKDWLYNIYINLPNPIKKVAKNIYKKIKGN